MSDEEAIKRLEALREMRDREIAHGEADDILLAVVRRHSPEVAEAWEETRQIVGFWYA